MNIQYLVRRALTLWKRTRPVSDYLAKRLLFRFLDNVSVLSPDDSVLPKSLILSDDARVLVLAPHSDDESIGCGGLLMQYSQQLEVVCLTDGSKGDPNMAYHQLVQTRESELAASMALAGIQNFRFLGIPDQALLAHYARFSSLVLTSFDYIFLPNFLDQHPDHKAVTRLLQQLLKQSTYKPSLKIAFYEIWGTLPVWNNYIALTPEMLDKKRQMIDCFASQTRQIDYATHIFGLHTYRGISVGQASVEAYLVLSVEDFLAIR